MSESFASLDEILGALPIDLHPTVESLAVEILEQDQPMRLILLGSFSVGKSSLLNMLIQESLLKAALEETTALPTFIEQAASRTLTLVGRDGSQSPLDIQQFTQVTTQAPEEAAYALVTLPLDWLQGVSIIDLPGLGSLNTGHQQYTQAQVHLADAVIYLLSPRGPSAADMETLRLVQQSGKRVKVLVSHWDEIEAATARGERAPSLEQWSKQIEQSSGLRVRLATCHYQGLGREELLEFIQRARDDLQNIRTQRFQAELIPVLENALGVNADLQRSCLIDNESHAKALHQELMQRKQRLVEFKSGLYEEQQTDRSRLSAQARTGLSDIREQLVTVLNAQAAELNAESSWDAFGQNGTRRLGDSIAQTAQLFSELSTDYGRIELPHAQQEAFNLRLPPAQSIRLDDFLDMGRLSQLQTALEEQALTQSSLIQRHESLQATEPVEQQQALQQLARQEAELAALPLAKIVEQRGSSSGAMFGRLLGEAADIGLMLVNPAIVGAKIATLVGKGAKVAKAVSTGVKVAKGIQQGKTVIRGVPQPIMNKLAGLEVLSLSYWGERIGAGFDGPGTTERVDPQALAERETALKAIKQQRHDMQRALARNEDIVNERQLTGWALEQNQKEQVRLRNELTRLQDQAEQQHREAEQHMQEARVRQLQRSTENAVADWLRSFDRQASAMDDLLHSRVRSYWEERVQALLDKRIEDIGLLDAQAQATAKERQTALESLQAQAKALESTLLRLH